MPLILGANSLTGGYEVDNSLRFNRGSSDGLSKTFGTNSNRKTFTISVWIKYTPTSGSGDRVLFGGADGAGGYFWFLIPSTGRLYIQNNPGSTLEFNTSQLFRDFSAWYHIVFAVDTTQATASNRAKLYINGTQVTAFITQTFPSLNQDLSFITSTQALKIGEIFSANYFDGYMSEINWIDGQQLDSTYFGEFDEDTGIWKPIAYEGTYGTNGFYLEFKDSSALGDDTSGNSNDFTVNNLTSIDQTTDTPTNNFATLNPLDYTGTIIASEGNTVFQGGRYRANFGVSAGKWYWEAKRLNAPDNAYIGIKADSGSWSSTWSESYTVYTPSGNYYLDGSDQGAYGNSSTTNDILMFALDMDNGKFYVGENGTWYNSGNPATSTNPMASSISGTYLPTVINNNSTGTDQYSFNFGNPSFTISSGNSDANGYGNFEYAVPSGYYALCTANLAEYG
jgi:hypothetical protein